MNVSLHDLPAGCVLAGGSGTLYRIVTPGVAARCGDDDPGQTWDLGDLDAADGPLVVVPPTPDELRAAALVLRRQAVVLEQHADRGAEAGR